MGVRTPNIDRLAQEGLRLTAFYGQPSCTAGRAAFITGQLPIRTGLTTVGTPGAPAGLQKEDIPLAEILKTHGYATAQFGKNHLGDLEEHLPHRHGFDEFFGNLYHLNGNEDLEDPDRPTNADFRKKFDPRGVISGTADGPTIDAKQGTTNALAGADGIAFDLFGNLYVCANQANQIQVISPNAELTAQYTSSTVTLDNPASLVFLGNRLFFTNASIFDGGVNSAVFVLQTPSFGLPPL